jgi:hypothetical protein
VSVIYLVTFFPSRFRSTLPVISLRFNPRVHTSLQLLKMPQFSSASSSSSQESLGFSQPPRYPTRRLLRAVESVDELDALGFAGVPRRRASDASSSNASLSHPPLHSFDAPPPPYCRFESAEHHLGFGGVSWSYDEPAVSNNVIMVSQGDVVRAKLRYKMHRLKMGKNANEWHVFLNKSLKPGEAPWAPLGSALWKVPRSESPPSPANQFPSPINTERRSSL